MFSYALSFERTKEIGTYYIDSTYIRNSQRRTESTNYRILNNDPDDYYASLLKNSTVSDAIETILNDYEPSIDMIEEMWKNLIDSIAVSNTSQWTNSLIIFNMLILQSNVNLSNLEKFAQDIYNLFSLYSNNFTLTSFELVMRITGTLYSKLTIESYHFTENFLIHYMKYFYNNNKNSVNNYQDDNIGFISIAFNNISYEDLSVTVNQNFNIEVNFTNGKDSLLLMVSLVIGIQGTEIINIVLMDLQTFNQINPSTILLNFIMSNTIKNEDILCKAYINYSWNSSLCNIIDSNSQQIHLSASNSTLISVYANCNNNNEPAIIAIIILSLGGILIPIFLLINSIKNKKIASSYAFTFKTDTGSIEQKSTYGKELEKFKKQDRLETSFPQFQVVRIQNPETGTKSWIWSYHIILSIIDLDYSEKLKNLLIYLNSLLMQLWLNVFIITNRDQNYTQSVEIGMISGLVVGVYSYSIFYFRESNKKMIRIMVYCSATAFGIFSAFHVIEGYALCSYKYWGAAYLISIFFDFLIIQSLLTLIRKTLN